MILASITAARSYNLCGQLLHIAKLGQGRGLPTPCGAVVYKIVSSRHKLFWSDHPTLTELRVLLEEGREEGERGKGEGREKGQRRDGEGRKEREGREDSCI